MRVVDTLTLLSLDALLFFHYSIEIYGKYTDIVAADSCLADFYLEPFLKDCFKILAYITFGTMAKGLRIGGFSRSNPATINFVPVYIRSTLIVITIRLEAVLPKVGETTIL